MRIATVNMARALRRRMTWHERRLWKRLRNRKQAGFKFRRQHPLGPYILDFYCTEKKVAVEVDGSGHAYADGRRKDMKRDRYLQEQGIRVIRVWNSQIRESLDGVMVRIRREMGAGDE